MGEELLEEDVADEELFVLKLIIEEFSRILSFGDLFKPEFILFK